MAAPHLADLHAQAAELGVEGYRMLRREDLVRAIEDAGGTVAPAEAAREAGAEPEPDEAVVEGTVLDDEAAEAADVDAEGPRDEDAPTEEVSGVLEILPQRYGFIRLRGLGADPEDVYISASQVRRCELRSGDQVAGPAREPRRGERHRALVHVDQVNGEEPLASERPDFEALPPVLPEGRVPLDADAGDVLARAVDLLNPLALGQRVLVRAAPRSGRTTLLRAIARAAAAQEGVEAIVLLIDERPEEATAWQEAAPDAQFAIATADQAPVDQVRLAGLALERARRIAESGGDAVLLVDSLSRLAYADGGVEEVKRLFGSGRNLSGGGSLTVVATTFADGDDEGEAERAVITTDSSLIVLDEALAAAGVYPAIDVAASRLSNEEELRPADELEAVRRLRDSLAGLDARGAADALRERIEGSPSNAELLRGL
jgi:transcription termination factor Rho